MKRFLLGLWIVAMASCVATKKTAPVPDAAMATQSNGDIATLRQGHTVYLAHCGRCHEHIMPKDVSKKDWHVVAPGMAWNAGISAADEKALTAYLLAASK